MKPVVCGAILGLFFSLTPPILAAEWVVKFDVVEQRVTESPDGKTPPKTENLHHVETVALNEKYLAVEDAQQRTIYDFTGFRLTRLDLKSNAYHASSLYPLAAFFEHELINRNALGAAMRAAKITQASMQFDRFWSESMLRMESRNAPEDAPPPKIQSSRAAGGEEFHCAGELVARFVPSEQKPTPALHHRFVNYLAYQCAIHPQIREALAITGALPQELTYHARNLNVTTVTTLRLLSFSAADSDSSLLPASAKLAAPEAADGLAAVLAAVDDVAAKPARPLLEDTIKFTDAAVAEGRILDAVLALIEYGLVTGEQPVDVMRKHRDHFATDPLCQKYFKALDQSSKEAAEQSLKLNDTIVRKNLKKAYILEVQRANLLDRAGRQPEAVSAFLGVLRANPYHTGALHDLGMIYARGYQEFDAWRCWDAARRLYPNHAMMREIIDFERRLVVRHLDFF